MVQNGCFIAFSYYNTLESCRSQLNDNSKSLNKFHRFHPRVSSNMKQQTVKMGNPTGNRTAQEKLFIHNWFCLFQLKGVLNLISAKQLQRILKHFLLLWRTKRISLSEKNCAEFAIKLKFHHSHSKVRLLCDNVLKKCCVKRTGCRTTALTPRSILSHRFTIILTV